MTALLFGAILSSAATAYLVGYRVVAHKDSFWRTKVGTWVLLMLGLTFILLPPQVGMMGEAAGMLGSTFGDMFTMPTWFNNIVYLVVWVVTTVAALLMGMRIWMAGAPDWRPGSSAATESPAIRAQGMLPLAESLDEVFATLTKAPLSPRDIEFLRSQLLIAGARFGSGLPQKRSDAFNMVVKHVPASIAVRVTEFLQEGAADKAAGN